MATSNWIVEAVRLSINFFLLLILHYSGKIVEKKKEEEKAIVKRYAFQANVKSRLHF